MRISVIVPTRGLNELLIENLLKCSKLDYEDYEVIVLSDEPFDLSYPQTRIYVTGKLTPSEKRNFGVQISTGEIIAFLDDDAFPREDWLESSCQVLSESSADVVCGPSISAPSKNVCEIAASAVWESVFISGPIKHRFVPSRPRIVDDFPSCNFVIKKSVFQEVGGFNQKLYPGEDTKLCLDITYKLGKKLFTTQKLSFITIGVRYLNHILIKLHYTRQPEAILLKCIRKHHGNYLISYPVFS